jgi:hypothetical protein
MANIVPPLAAVVTTGGTAVAAIPVGPLGGWITNPPGATESLFINPTRAGGIVAGGESGTTFELLPGQTWTVVPGQTTQTFVNAVTNGHAFSAIYWVN